MSSFDFSHYTKASDISEKTAWMELPALASGPDSETPSLQVRPAVSSMNVAMRRLSLRLSATPAAQRRARKKLGKFTEKDQQAVQEDNVRVLSETVIIGWRGIRDSNGQEVPFSAANAAAFLRAVPLEVSLDILEFAQDPDNFVSGAGDIEELGNS